MNGDDPDAVYWVFQLYVIAQSLSDIFRAAEWRQKFHRDVVVDVVCYRRFGHNELDQPSFTQPLMYQAITTHPKVLELYSSRLITEGLWLARIPDLLIRCIAGESI